MRISDWIQTCALPIFISGAGLIHRALARYVTSRFSIVRILSPSAPGGSVGRVIYTGIHCRAISRSGTGVLLIRYNVDLPPVHRIFPQPERQITAPVSKNILAEIVFRSEERRVGKECVSTCRSRRVL